MSDLVMTLETLKDIPLFVLPEAFRLRAHRPGDEELWARIQNEADEFQEIDRSVFDAQFGSDSREHGRRIFYMETNDGEPVGSIAAWYGESDFDAAWGRIHWVAILPAWQGKGLSKPLMTAALERLRELGHEKAYLTTDTRRAGAIALYRKFGFD